MICKIKIYKLKRLVAKIFILNCINHCTKVFCSFLPIIFTIPVEASYEVTYSMNAELNNEKTLSARKNEVTHGNKHTVLAIYECVLI